MVDDRELLRRKALVLGAAASNATPAEGKQEEDDELVMLHFQDVREELELSGHNLTSVLNNPRETFMDSLYEAAFEAEPPLPDLEVVRANVPHGMREVTPQVCGCVQLAQQLLGLILSLCRNQKSVHRRVQ